MIFSVTYYLDLHNFLPTWKLFPTKLKDGCLKATPNYPTSKGYMGRFLLVPFYLGKIGLGWTQDAITHNDYDGQVVV